MAKEVVRQDVIEVSWEIDNNPLSKLINEVTCLDNFLPLPDFPR